jgi:hypothetical protein
VGASEAAAVIAPVGIAAAAGAIVALHPLLVHGGPPNRSRRHRRLLITQWGHPDAVLREGPRESLTGLTVAEIAARIRPAP